MSRRSKPTDLSTVDDLADEPDANATAVWLGSSTTVSGPSGIEYVWPARGGWVVVDDDDLPALEVSLGELTSKRVRVGNDGAAGAAYTGPELLAAGGAVTPEPVLVRQIGPEVIRVGAVPLPERIVVPEPRPELLDGGTAPEPPDDGPLVDPQPERLAGGITPEPPDGGPRANPQPERLAGGAAAADPTTAEIPVPERLPGGSIPEPVTSVPTPEPDRHRALVAPEQE